MLTRKDKMDTDKCTAKGARGTAVARLHSVLRGSIWLLITLGSLAWVSRPADAAQNYLYVLNSGTKLTKNEKRLLELSTQDDKNKLLQFIESQKVIREDDEDGKEIGELLTNVLNIATSGFKWEESMGVLNRCWSALKEKKDITVLKTQLTDIQRNLIDKCIKGEPSGLMESDMNLIVQAFGYLEIPKYDSAEWEAIALLPDEAYKTSRHVDRIKKVSEAYFMYYSANILRDFSKDFTHVIKVLRNMEGKSEGPTAAQWEQIILPWKMATVLTATGLEPSEPDYEELMNGVMTMSGALTKIRTDLAEGATLRENCLHGQQETLLELAERFREEKLSGNRKSDQTALLKEGIGYYTTLLKSMILKMKSEKRETIQIGAARVPKPLTKDGEEEDNKLYNLELAVKSSGNCKTTHIGMKDKTFCKQTEDNVHLIPEGEKEWKCDLCSLRYVELGNIQIDGVGSKKWPGPTFYNLNRKQEDNLRYRGTLVSNLDPHRSKFHWEDRKPKKLPVKEVEFVLLPPENEQEEVDAFKKEEARFKELQPKLEWDGKLENSNANLVEFGVSFEKIFTALHMGKYLSNKKLELQEAAALEVEKAEKQESETPSSQEEENYFKMGTLGHNSRNTHSWMKGLTCFSILSIVIIMCILLTVLFYLKSLRGSRNGGVELRGAR